MYGLLLAIPIGGWVGISMFGATNVFGLFDLPSIAAQNQETAKLVFFFHKVGAILLVLAIAAHIGAAIFHHFIRKDGVLRRMLPSVGRRE
jgi:cytochrome b561